MTLEQGGISQEVDDLSKRGTGLDKKVIQRITREVKDRYSFRIDNEIHDELQIAENRERETVRERRERLRDRICAGETTGDRAKDIVFAVTGHLAENNLESISGALKRFDEAFAHEENPLVLNMYLYNREIRTWSIAKLEKPGISLNKDGIGLIYARLATKGHSNWFDVLEKPEYHDFPLTLFELDNIESNTPFETAFEKGDVEGKEFFLLGAKDIRDTLVKHPELEFKVLSALQLYLAQNDEMLKNFGDEIRTGKASLLILGSMYERFGSHEVLGSAVKDIPEKLTKITGRTAALTELKAKAIMALMLSEIGGYIDVGGSVTWVEEQDKKPIALAALNEASALADWLDTGVKDKDK